MKFRLQYLYNNALHSCGFLTNDTHTFRSFVIADPPRYNKIAKITRFKAGVYPLKINKVDTPLTLKHRLAYNKGGNNWFKYHIEVTGVPDYSGIYVHSGVDATHTDGCVTLMYGFIMTEQHNQGLESLSAVIDFYKIVYPLLEKCEVIFLEVLDEQF